MKKVLFFVFTYYLHIQNSIGQINVTYSPPYDTPQFLVENILTGVGVTTSNWTYNGSPLQLGFFNNGLSSIGLDSGIVISTDEITGIDPDFIGFPDTDFSTISNSDLLSVANSVPPLIGESFSLSQVQDVAILEFDFIPSADTVNFRFVFGSDEYLTWVNTQFNDVFAFFIAGPGITGPYSSPAAFPGGSKNIAVVPGSTPPLPITISSVNNVLNSAYYINNPSNIGVNLNGYTQILTATSPVLCGETYHIKLAIADGSDQALKSAVFIEAASFSSIGDINVNVITTSGENTIVEGCTDAQFIFVRNDTTKADTIVYEISGSAQNGVDYDFINDSLFFAIGVDSLILSINPIADGLTEGTDSVIIKITTITPCGDTIIDSTTIYILDEYSISVSISGENVCDGDSAFIYTEITGASNPIQYEWQNGQTDSILQFIPDTSGYHLVEISDFYGCSKTSDSIFIQVYPVPSLEVSNDTTVCPGDTLLLIATGADNYTWIPNSYLNNNTNDSVISIPLNPTLYTITGINEFNCKDTAQILIGFLPYPSINGVKDTAVCKGDDAQLEVFGNGIFEWKPAEGLSSPNISNPIALNVEEDKTYYVTLNDSANYSCKNVKAITIYVFEAEVDIKDTSICKAASITLNAQPNNGTAPYSYQWSPASSVDNPNSANPLVTVDKEFTISVVITDAKGCKDTAQADLGLLPFPKIEFEKSTQVTCDSALVLYTNNTSNANSFIWTINDTAIFISKNVQYLFPFETNYTISLEASNDLGCKDKVVLSDSIAEFFKYYELIIPNVFTPNNDNMNEKFTIPQHELLTNCTEIKVYNRWGKLVYESNETSNAWDGNNKNGNTMEDGVYYYYVRFKNKNYSGTVHLMR